MDTARGAAGVNPCVLLVDDDEIICRLLSRYVDSLGVRSRSAHDLGAARVLLESEAFGLVLLDLDLGGKDGYELARWVRQQGMRVPIVLLSGEFMDQEEEEEEGGEDVADSFPDCNGCLAKPCDQSMLRHTFQRFGLIPATD